MLFRSVFFQDAEQQSLILEKHHHYGNVHAVEKLRQSMESRVPLLLGFNPNLRLHTIGLWFQWTFHIKCPKEYIHLIPVYKFSLQDMNETRIERKVQ